MALTVNVPLQSGYGGQNNNAMQSFFTVDKPQMANIVFYNNHGILPMNIFKTMGLQEELAGMLSQHFEADWVHPNFHAGNSISAGGPGQQLVINVAASDVVNGTVYSRVTDTIEQSNGNWSSVVAKNLVGGTWQLTLNPYDPTVTLSVTQGDALWIIANVQAEGGTSPAPRDTGRQLFQYPVQIFGECWNATDQGLTNELWFAMDQLGQSRTTYNSGYIDSEYRFLTQLGNAMVFQTPNTNPSNTDVNLYGIDYVVNSVGNVVDYFNGSYGINEVKENLRYANKLGSGGRFFVMSGPEMQMSFNTGSSDVLAQNPNQFVHVAEDSTYTAQFAGGYAKEATEEGLMTDITFTSLKWGTTKLFFNEIKQWGYDSTGGANGWNTSGNAYMIPLSRCEDVEGTVQDRFRMTYKKLADVNLAMFIWLTGAFAPNPTSDQRIKQINFSATWGTKFFGPQHFQGMVEG